MLSSQVQNLDLYDGTSVFLIPVSSMFLFLVVGPVVAEAMFVNREEIPVHPIYRDPVSL